MNERTAPRQVLAIECAIEAISVALVDERHGVLGARALEDRRSGAEALLPAIESLRIEIGFAYPDLSAIAATIGPGSFTGIRVGLAAARGLALASGCRALGVSTLATIAAAYARRVAFEGEMLVAIDARRGEVYCQRFRVHPGRLTPDPLTSAALLTVADAAAHVTKGAIVAGNGAAFVVAASGRAASIVHCDFNATDVAFLTIDGLSRATEFASPRPLYLRPPDAVAREASNS